MKTLVFGSCNLDYIYSVERIVSPGETVPVTGMHLSPGGKGLNQAIALKKAGLDVYFAGCYGTDGASLKTLLEQNGVDVSCFLPVDCPNGQAHIQVAPNGGNAILLYRGANGRVTRAMIDETLARFSAGDLLVLQNEISELPYLIDAGFRRGMRTVLNPSPYMPEMSALDYGKIWLVFINEVELAGLAGGRSETEFVADMRARYPDTLWAVTLGEKGSFYFDKTELLRQGIFPVAAVDTTCAGDTFTGYFTAALCAGKSPAEALRRAAAASGITVSRMGAAGMIPSADEVEAMLRT